MRRGLAALAFCAMASAASATDYSFSFSSTGGSITYNGIGTITSAGPGQAITAANFVINGQSYVLNTSGNGFGGKGDTPTLVSTNVGNLFDGASQHNALAIGISSTSSEEFVFQSSGTVDTIFDFQNGSRQDSASLTGESFGPAPGPLPGGGALSWGLAGLAALGFAFRRRVAGLWAPRWMSAPRFA